MLCTVVIFFKYIKKIFILIIWCSWYVFLCSCIIPLQLNLLFVVFLVNQIVWTKCIDFIWHFVIAWCKYSLRHFYFLNFFFRIYYWRVFILILHIIFWLRILRSSIFYLMLLVWFKLFSFFIFVLNFLKTSFSFFSGSIFMICIWMVTSFIILPFRLTNVKQNQISLYLTLKIELKYIWIL